MSLNTQKGNRFLTTKELCTFALLGAIMYCGKIFLEFLPNIHLVGVLIVSYTFVYRSKALIPLYIFVFLTGLLGGFSFWWIPYLYIWLPLWGVSMLLPRKKGKYTILLCSLVCSLHGAFFGILYAPAQALLFGLDSNGMIAWIIAGLPWDLTHAIGNFVGGFLIVPISSALSKINDLSFR